MNLSEIIIMVFPILWISGEAFSLKKEYVSWGARWLVLAIGCLLLSFIMIRKLSVMMGGGLLWCEVIYYGWFLFALFVILRAFKKCLLAILEKIKCFRISEKVNQGINNLIVFALLFILAIPFFLAMTSVHRPKIRNIYNPRTTLGLAYEDVTLDTRDNLKIKGWFVPAKSNKAVIIAHGLGANKSNFIGTVDIWNLLGFNILIFDFRGHGDSDGHTVSFGYKERYDVIAGMDYLIREKKFLPENIWGYGVSFGGAAMLHAAAEDRRFRGLVIDSSFADLDHMAERIIAQEAIILPFCRRLIKEIGMFFLRWDVGYDIRSHSPQKAVQHLFGLPILFIHGKGDPLIPWTETELLYKSAREPKQFYLINTAGHYATLNDPKYVETIKNFIIK